MWCFSRYIKFCYNLLTLYLKRDKTAKIWFKGGIVESFIIYNFVFNY